MPGLNDRAYSTPAWVKRAGGLLPALDMDFKNDRYFIQGQNTPAKSLWTFTRASVAWYPADNGLWVQAASGEMRRTSQGFLSEHTTTNVCIQNRDLTNVAWVSGGGGITAAKDQVGIDGVTNSASSILAAGANGTLLQTITLASSTRLQSCFIKRLVGSGNIDMTTDGGTTWNTVTVTSAWSLVWFTQAAVTNPVVGFRIVTSGDKVAIDMVQSEVGSVFDVPTSPISTTTVAVTRAVDKLNLTTANVPFFNATGGTLLGMGMIGYPGYWAGITSVTVGAGTILGLSDNTINQRIQVRYGAGGFFFAVIDGNVVQASIGVTATQPGVMANIGSYTANNFRSWAASEASIVTVGTADAAGTVPIVTQFDIGGGNAGVVQEFCGFVQRCTYWPIVLDTYTSGVLARPPQY